MAEPFIKFSVPELRDAAGKSVIRDAQGRYNDAVKKQYDYNKALALATQGRVVAIMRNHIAFGGRASASTGRLLRVTADPRNIQTGNLSFGVGVTRYLDGSVAKYWRTFEEGSAAVWKRPFIGTQLTPFGGRTTSPSAHGSRPGVRTATSALPFLEGRYIVKREIAPAAIYRQVSREQRLPESAAIGAVNFLNRVLGKEVRQSGGYFD